MKKKKLKIAIFNWRSPWDSLAGGAEYVTFKHAKYWIKKGHKVTWISGKSDKDINKDKYIKSGIEFYSSKSSRKLFLKAWFIYFFVFKANFDVVVDEVHGLPMFSPLWAIKSKKIAFIHELAQEIWDKMFPFPINILGRFLETKIMPLVYQKTTFWVDSPSTKKDLRNIGIKSPIHVISCAIESPKIKIIKEKKLNCLFISRLVKMKGVEAALKSFSHIYKEKPKAKFWIIGEGHKNYVKKLKRMSQGLGIYKACIFLGKISEGKKYQLLAKSHFLIHTSVREGFGLTVLEANSQKTPVAVFDVPALRDIVKHNRTGLISKKKDPQALANLILSLYGNKKRLEKMQTEAYLFSQKFKWPIFTQESLNLIKSL